MLPTDLFGHECFLTLVPRPNGSSEKSSTSCFSRWSKDEPVGASEGPESGNGIPAVFASWTEQRMEGRRL